MNWFTSKEASVMLGMTKSSLQNRALRGTWPRQVIESTEHLPTNQKRFRYAVPSSPLEAIEYGLERYVDDDGVMQFVDVMDEYGQQEESTSTKSEKKEDFKSQDPEMKRYLIEGDRYIFSLPSKPRTPWVVPKDQVETLVSMYSNDGDRATWNQIGRVLGWHKRTVMETLKALGKTHDSLPFTDDQIHGTDEDSLVEDLVRRKEEKVHIRASRVAWKKTQDLADKALNWQKFVDTTLSNMVVPPPPAIPAWKAHEFRRQSRSLSKSNDLTIVSHATDLHYGKYGWVDQVGEEYSREITRDNLFRATDNLHERVGMWGTPDRVVLGVGADWFHIDGHSGTTTKGTPQDHDGCYLRIFTEGCALARDHIEHWRQHSKEVDVIAVRGNHDYMSTALLVHWLKSVYADCPDVTIGNYAQDREYVRIGSTLLGLTHGDGVSDKDLGSLMAMEAKEHWSETEFRMWLTGHWHSQIVSENYGVLVEHAPSLAGSDAWHSRKGFVGNRKALSGYLIDHNEGPFAKVTVGCK